MERNESDPSLIDLLSTLNNLLFVDEHGRDSRHRDSARTPA